MPVHLYGHPADMPSLQAVADRHGLQIFEDAAQAHGASLDGVPVGAFGTFAVFSLYPTKNMTSGEGGMVAVGDPEVERLLRLYRNQGMERRYENEVVGFNARMTDIHAAIGRVQLTRLAAWTRRRQDNAACLDAELSGVRSRPWRRGPCTSTTSTRSGCPRTVTGSPRRSSGSTASAPASTTRSPTTASRRSGRTSTCRRPNAPRASALAAGPPVGHGRGPGADRQGCQRSCRRGRLTGTTPPHGPARTAARGRTARGAVRGLSPRAAPRQGCPDQAAFLVSQKISAIWSILASSSSALARSLEPLVPVAPASLVASLKRVCSSGYFSKCGGLK